MNSAGQEAPQTREGWIEYFSRVPADERVSRAIDCLLTTQAWASGAIARAATAAAPASALVELGELQRLREIEHRVWHLLDDSEECKGYQAVDNECEDWRILDTLLPEGHPRASRPDTPAPASALVARLREMRIFAAMGPRATAFALTREPNPVAQEAADALERLARERDEARINDARYRYLRVRVRQWATYPEGEERGEFNDKLLDDRIAGKAAP